MDDTDKKILENEVSVVIGNAVSRWIKKNGIEDPVVVQAHVMQPTCYIDDMGVSHSGQLITVNCHIVDIDDDDDDDDY